MRLARHRRQGELAGERLGRGVVERGEHVGVDDGEGVVARVHRRDDGRLVRVGLDEALGIQASASHCSCL